MSSETITRNDLTNILNEVLPATSKVEYDTHINISTNDLINGYTATRNGILTVDVGKSTSGVAGYFYVKDTTINWDVMKLTWTSSNGTSLTCSTVMVKGHTYLLRTQAEVSWSYCVAFPFAEPVATVNAGNSDFIVEQGTDGIWTYTKWNNGSYEAVYVGTVNMQAGSAMGGGYFHQTSSALTPPYFSQTVKSLHGSANGAVLFSYVGHASDYSTYWWNASSGAVNNVAVRLVMHGTWK